jgi:hypothetical protein
VKPKFYGVLVMALAGTAVIIASIVIFIKSLILGFLYLGILFIAAPAVIYVFCAKCSHKKDCPHVLPGKAALLINRVRGPYTKTEITAVIIAFLLILGTPQFWLWNHFISLITFWSLIIISLILIPLKLCSFCDNKFCPLHNNINSE